MSRPAKSALGDDIRGHRTKDEISTRQEAEKSLYTGVEMSFQAGKKDHKKAFLEFKRIKKLYQRINKDDDLYSGCITTYCLLFEECDQTEKWRNDFEESQEKLETEYRNKDGIMEASVYYKLLSNSQKNILECDRALMTKRKMMLDIAKENLLTCQSSLRSVPKKPEKKKNSRIMNIIHEQHEG